MPRSISGSNYTVPAIDCCKGSSTCRSIAHVSFLIWTAPWLRLLVIKKVLRLVTIRAIAASAPTTRCFVWKQTPPSSGMSNCDAAMREPGRAARNYCLVVSSPVLPIFASSGRGPMRASVTDRCWTCWKRVRRPNTLWFRA